MAEVLQEYLRNVNVYFDRENEFPKGRGPLKTYVLEAHPMNGEVPRNETSASILAAVAKASELDVVETKDRALFQVKKGEVGFFFDVLDPRFWLVHTMSNIDDCEQVLDSIVESHPNFDYAWPPSYLMRGLQEEGKPLGFAVDFDETELLPSAESHLSEEPNAVVKFRFGGTRAQAWLYELEKFAPDAMAFSMVKFSRADDATNSYIINELNERGRFKAAGNSFNLHIQNVARFLDCYKSFITEIEAFAKFRSYGTGSGGGSLAGEPLVVAFPRPLRNFSAFVRELVSCRSPLKIWGIVEEVRKDFVHVEAADLHTGSRLRIDLSPNFMRFYLGPHACGNTVARLLRNLQSHVDSTIKIEIPTESVPA